MNEQQVINTHPSFRMKCICRTSSHRLEITKAGTEPRIDSMCLICASQLEALGYKTKMI